jgi:hypothetical protein
MENNTELLVTDKKTIFPANVVRVIDRYKLAINRGLEDGLRLGQRILVYKLSNEEIIDPNTEESLGYLEIVKGTGKVIHIQDRLSTIESDKKEIKRTINNYNNPYIPRGFSSSASEVIESTELIPFDNPELGDLVKPI